MPSSPVERKGSRPAERRERARPVEGEGGQAFGEERGQKEKERAPRTEYWKRTGVSVTLAVPSLPEVEVEEVEETGEVDVTLTKLLVRR